METGERRQMVVGVYRDARHAQQVVDALITEGILQSDIRVGDEHDTVTAMRSEMREELEHTVAGPGSVGPKEMTKGIAVLAAIGALIGAIVALPLALVPMGGLDWWARVLIVVAVGALAGGAVGFVVGGALGAKGPADALAAQRGVTVAVTGDIDRTRRVMSARGPIRLDLVESGRVPVDALETDEDEQPGITQDLSRHLRADDYRRGDA
jgi:hypothetical protein